MSRKSKFRDYEYGTSWMSNTFDDQYDCMVIENDEFDQNMKFGNFRKRKQSVGERFGNGRKTIIDKDMRRLTQLARLNSQAKPIIGNNDYINANQALKAIAAQSEDSIRSKNGSSRKTFINIYYASVPI